MAQMYPLREDLTEVFNARSESALEKKMLFLKMKAL